ncbi:MAG: hypothetical protein WCI20_00235 [bacterium]
MIRVCWEIDVDARTPMEAARKALAIQRDPASIATVFDVQYRGKMVRVDLSDGIARHLPKNRASDLIRELIHALEHAQRRLNDIPHRYADTDFKLIRETLAKAASGAE